MQMEINVLVDEELKDKLEIGWLRGVAQQVLTALDVDTNVELSLFIATGERVKQLNRDYLGRDELTDVLAFSAREEAGGHPPFVQPPDGVLHLGEVIIAYPQAVAQAGEYKHSVEREILTLIVHGVLHLLGYEHDTPELELKMRAREKEIIDHIGGLN
jgi:probable rRNA maturation factor